MERLRYVALAGRTDPATIVSETVAAINHLGPSPSELVVVCRKLIDNHPTCGPLWWLCANMLAGPGPGAGRRALALAANIVGDPTADRLAAALPDDAVVLVVGHPAVVAEALRSRADVEVLAVDAGGRASGLLRRLDRAGVVGELVAPESMLAATGAATVVLVEAEACAPGAVITATGGGLATLAAIDAGVPVWLVAGRGRRLPRRYVDAIAARLGDGGSRFEDELEAMPTCGVARIAGPDGVVVAGDEALAAECPLIPELLSVNTV